MDNERFEGFESLEHDLMSGFEPRKGFEDELWEQLKALLPEKKSQATVVQFPRPLEDDELDMLAAAGRPWEGDDDDPII